MAYQPVFVTLTVLIIHILFSQQKPASGKSLVNANQWCNQTPFPQVCEQSLSGHPNSGIVDQKSDFLKLALQLALDGALRAQSTVDSLGSKCNGNKEKAAWLDCGKLYDYTILRLNKTIHTTKCTWGDSQTWLSTALTNLETCRAGFVELGVINHILPLMLIDSVGIFIRNALALNKLLSSKFEVEVSNRYEDDGFPDWVKPSDQKLLQQPSSSLASQANLVVAKDGSGNYKTIGEAIINAASKWSGSGRFVILVKEGTYDEKVEIGNNLNNVMLVGDGIGKTIITGSRSVQGGYTTFNSSTVSINGDGFLSRGITYRNTAGAINQQAVAVLSLSDLSAFYECSFEGYQDTLYVHSGRQFFRECDIYGTVDFIFGNAAVVFQKCNIYARKPIHNMNVVTAQGRTDPNQNTGISIHNSKVIAAPELKAVQSDTIPTYLGRPWQKYSRTVFIVSYLDNLIDPAGWKEWDGNFALDTLYYGEYGNTGDGASTKNRVTWSGYHVLNAADASKFTVETFISGSDWLPSTGVPFDLGL
ncbi:pectinesterase-like [Malania oleifera]|uniref:pectinesterase-like n=1 Tax=Malania oleifera TaxID=397392 RepID=UPI0025ADCD7E|nr:pectinesterase-like [Malania oleifera]